MYLIRIRTSNNQGCWLTSFSGGDPARTLVKESALRFKNKATCESKIKMLAKKYPNRHFSLDVE